MERIPTAEEILSNWMNDHPQALRAAQNAMKEFAKLHVKAALEEANKKIKREICISGASRYILSDKESILNAYPETNIK